MSVWAAISQQIEATTGRPFEVERQRSVGGGSINAAYVARSKSEAYFVKLNAAAQLNMFKAEAAGLNELAEAGVIRVPQVICWGTEADSAYLVLEYLELGSGKASSSEELGRQLARLHQVKGPCFGWHINNTIGATPQVNTYSDKWTEFWRQHRLGYQLSLAASKGHRGELQRKGERLLAELHKLFVDYSPDPVLLHGDLWSGNWGTDTQGNPVIFDPAVYYGDRETDLAMTELFGGFTAQFYRAYQAELPLDSGYSVRKILYNLYHVLNHLNLFGGNYLSQADNMIDRLLSEI
ncbi:fructosamine kinase family protein [Leptolyngbya sp. FACHB-261]|uniref:fructosamine kinase family protein n=1 Tax=Leptolyngbya sp. FACHB-261 TaxID=2692806 RepID=UPI0016890B7A|nr:fructosamine kinase family protein [Leptolyngbya sp. FACHB-261]MBD2103886.1 fructosamine kinase family protein [Leptolyngbya sp. FACHB-261]